MGTLAIACYKPKAGCEGALRELVRDHLRPLRDQGLATDRAPIAGVAADGTIVEIFEWVSEEAIVAAHSNPVVLDLWRRFFEVCDCVSPSSLAEFQGLFGSLSPLD